MRIVLMSDTHGYPGDDVLKLLEDCDEIWHAGDIGSEKLLDDLEASDKKQRIVYGNIDGHKIRLRCPEHLVFTLEGMKFLITHIGGYPKHYPAQIRQLLQDIKPDAFICGHSHILKVMYDHDYTFLHMNPGACGKEGFHKIRTLLRFTVEDARIKNMEIIELKR